jgi:hypothetical protein
MVESIDEVRGTNLARFGACRDLMPSRSAGEIGGDSPIVFEVSGADTLRSWRYLSSFALSGAWAPPAGALSALDGGAPSSVESCREGERGTSPGEWPRLCGETGSLCRDLGEHEGVFALLAERGVDRPSDPAELVVSLVGA